MTVDNGSRIGIMKNLSFITLAGLISLSAAAGKSPFDGVWEGTINDLPGVEITIRDNGRPLEGTICFYFQTRANESEKWHVAGKSIGPLLVPKVDGNILTFETTHHKSHGSSELGPNVGFELELMEVNEIALRKLGDTQHSSIGMKLRRRETAAPK